MGMDSGRLETVPAGTVNLDTVRALHQTVVSLRTALEVSKNELKELKEKYQKHSDCIGYADVIEKLSIENHILRSRIIDTNFDDRTPGRNIKLQVTYSPKHQEDLSSDVFIHTATTDAKSPIISTGTPHDDDKEVLTEEGNRSVGEELEVEDQVICSQSEKSEVVQEGHEFCGTAESLKQLDEEQSSAENVSLNSPMSGQEESPDFNTSIVLSPQNGQEDSPQIEATDISQLDDKHGIYRAKLELFSKFDVKIKVHTVTENSVLSSTTSDSESIYGERRERDFKKKTADEIFGKRKDDIFGKDLEEKYFGKDDKGTDTHIHFIGKSENFEKNKKNRSFPNNPKDKGVKNKGANIHFEGKREQFENIEDLKGNKVNVKTVSSENLKMAVSNEGDTKAKVDNIDIQVRVTSEENFVVKETTEKCRSKDALNLDVDNLSMRSMSEGDSSMFSEQAMTPMDQAAAIPLEQENSDESEVDDIELIFTTDETKDMSNLQEDLVSIRDSDTWTPQPSASAHSTPVLIKFHTLDPDFTTSGDTDIENQENASKPDSLKTKRVSLPSDKEISIRHVAFNRTGDLPGRGILKSCDNKSDNMLYRKSPHTSTKRLSSVDSLTGELNKALSFDNTKSSSFELGSSMDMIHRDESEDSFHRLTHLGHRFSVFAESDMSKCGISEDDLAANMYVRRNTCPNPFQYRAGPLRSVSRPPGPLKVVGAGARLRPILRDGRGPRTDSGAQTDVTALPPRWGSDGYLAYQQSGPRWSRPLPPLGPGPARAPPPPPRQDTRRLLLSDIGFTSMVPELSRSADPLCALARRVPSGMDSDTFTTTSTARLVSRGSSYRSPSLSMDRSSEWTPQTLPLPGISESRSWRASLPDVRSRSHSPDTARLLTDADRFLRCSADSLRVEPMHLESVTPPLGQPYIPREPKQLRLGHSVKVITPCGRVAVGRVRYVGIAGATAANSAVVVGAEFPLAHGGLLRNDGMLNGRRYFLTAPHYTALFVPFNKVVMAWAN